MEIRLILFQEIGFGISWNNRADFFCISHWQSRKENQLRDFPSSSKPNLHFAEVQLKLCGKQL